jgi:hypothetical protein
MKRATEGPLVVNLELRVLMEYVVVVLDQLVAGSDVERAHSGMLA